MTYLIGTDEAGYGPNLGPLVISATLWQIPDGAPAESLYERLAEVVAPVPVRGRNGEFSPVAIADSKRLYQQGKGLAQLERGVMAALASLDRQPSTWRELCAALSPDSLAQCDCIPWYAGYDCPVPVDAEPLAGPRDAARWQAAFQSAGVCLLEVRSRIVFEGPFNERIDRCGNKAEALSQITLGLVAELLAPLAPQPTLVICDKHGGRNRYQHLLADCFPEWLIEVYDEGRDLSRYRFGPPERRVEFRFCTRAESYLPTALASMASKYLRELAMAALNDFWCRQVPGLTRTAGYPVDAQRFKQAIAAAQAALGIDDNILWRKR
jgi:ribonuclease HII